MPNGEDGAAESGPEHGKHHGDTGTQPCTLSHEIRTKVRCGAHTQEACSLAGEEEKAMAAITEPPKLSVADKISKAPFLFRGPCISFPLEEITHLKNSSLRTVPRGGRWLWHAW